MLVYFSAVSPISIRLSVTCGIRRVRRKRSGPFDRQRRTCINFYSYHKWQWKKKSVVSRVMSPSRKCQFSRRSREGRRPFRLCIFLAVFIYLYFSLRPIRARVALSMPGANRYVLLRKAATHGTDDCGTRDFRGDVSPDAWRAMWIDWKPRYAYFCLSQIFLEKFLSFNNHRGIIRNDVPNCGSDREGNLCRQEG